MAFYGYLNVEGVPGESTDSEHKDWINIKGFSHSVSMTIAEKKHYNTPGRPSLRYDHGQFIVEKLLDSTTPTLSLYCSNGNMIKTVKVNLCRAIEQKSVPYMQYEMEDVFITKVAAQGFEDGKYGNMPFEEVTFYYAKIFWIYTQIDQETGTKSKVVETNWNTVKNQQD